MVKIPTAQELTGRQINITPGAKPNFLLPSNAMTEPYLNIADASQRAGNAIVDYAVSLQDAKNKTILNNAVLGMKDEMQTFQQELYRGQIIDLEDGTQSITPYDPLKFSELLELDELLTYFPMLKPTKLMEQDVIWAKFCKHLKWEFYPTT